MQAEAQPAAQATMRVSVSIESGITAKVDVPPVVMVTRKGIEGYIGSVQLSDLNDKQYILQTEQNLTLENSKGENVVLPVTIKNSMDSDHVGFRFEGTSTTLENGLEGIYSGVITTTVNYF